jgi:plastocyanin
MNTFTQTRLSAVMLVVAVAVAALASAADGATAATQTVNGSVGPGFTITLTMQGKKVAKLKAGTYRFVISDRSDIHDFHLSGPGLNRVLTAVDFTGTKTVSLTLRRGTYRFQCDPHASFMHGAFRVG